MIFIDDCFVDACIGCPFFDPERKVCYTDGWCPDPEDQAIEDL